MFKYILLVIVGLIVFLFIKKFFKARVNPVSYSSTVTTVTKERPSVEELNSRFDNSEMSMKILDYVCKEIDSNLVDHSYFNLDDGTLRINLVYCYANVSGMTFEYKQLGYQEQTPRSMAELAEWLFWKIKNKYPDADISVMRTIVFNWKGDRTSRPITDSSYEFVDFKDRYIDYAEVPSGYRPTKPHHTDSGFIDYGGEYSDFKVSCFTLKVWFPKNIKQTNSQNKQTYKSW